MTIQRTHNDCIRLIFDNGQSVAVWLPQMTSVQPAQLLLVREGFQDQWCKCADMFVSTLESIAEEKKDVVV